MTVAPQEIEITPEEIAVRTAPLSEDELDALPYGAIMLDAHGFVLRYNRYEEALAGRRREEVIGRHFFREVAPCTALTRFQAEFDRGLESGRVSALFDFVFHFPSGARRVRVRLLGGQGNPPAVWAFITEIRR